MDGYNTVKDLTTFNNWTQSFRYKVLKLEKNGEYFLYKRANDDFTKQLLKNEVRFRDFFNKLDIENVYTTKIARHGDGYILFEWLDADLLAERNKAAMAGFKGSLGRYVSLMVEINRAGIGYKPGVGEELAIKPESRFDTPWTYQKRLKGVLDEGWITRGKINGIQKLHEKYLPFSKNGYQHGDFTPWHIFTSGKKWFIYDAEHATSLRSRYTDLVHSYARIACQCKSPGLAAEMLGKFLDQSDVGEQEFKNIAMSEFIRKAGGSVVDSFNDRGQADFKNEAMNFLDNVLADDLNRLAA